MPHVLIIEDDEDLRPVLAGILRASGFSVTDVNEGVAGLQAAEAHPPDIVISDIVMEGMEGIAAIMALRKLMNDVPIIAISGSQRYLASSEKLGADAVLLKPFTRETILDAVNGLLARRTQPA
ncbi:response regulator [Thalassospiraceae bacterium LMO-JJ14]|nr:response regulator [Thalassospiraceae bacterium LMO-JJ14]